MSKLPPIVGIAGTNGSGKDTVGHLLSKSGYYFVSVTDLMRSVLVKLGREPTRSNMRELSTGWRRESNNLGVLVDKAVDEFKATPGEYTGLAIASLRNLGEADRVHELGGVVIWVDADPKLRYERIQANIASRSRGADDALSFKKFQEQEAVEMKPSNPHDKTVLNVAEVKAKSDIFVDNSQDLGALERELKEALFL